MVNEVDCLYFVKFIKLTTLVGDSAVRALLFVISKSQTGQIQVPELQLLKEG
ncbi:hypothetical protein LCL95_11765 [Bacillus timonensis]|nr:hypothetical protein [Bacillus timonensis]